MMSFATGGVRDMLDNWVRHVRMLGLPILVAAMDDEVLGRCNAERFDCYSCVQPQEEVPRYIRGDFSGFRALGVHMRIDLFLDQLGVPRLGLTDYMWLEESNTGVSSSCLGPGHCATTFAGPLGLGASFNRTSWRLKGTVIGNEMRAMNNIGWYRDAGGTVTEKIGLTGYVSVATVAAATFHTLA